MCSPDVNMHHMHKVYSKLSFVDSAESVQLRSKGSVVMRALAYHQFGPGSNPSFDAQSELSLLREVFSASTPVFPYRRKP